MELTISRITDDREHEAAIARIDTIWDSEEPAHLDEMNILTFLVDAYENTRWPIGDALDPVDIIKGAMEHAGHERAELVRLIGSASGASQILSRKRPLTLDMIRTVSDAWGIPITLLTPAYELDRISA